MQGDTTQTSQIEEFLAGLEGQPARTPESFVGMLGWNSVGVFRSGECSENGTKHVSRDTVFVVMVDPAPEFQTIVFLDGEFHHSGSLLSIEYEDYFDEQFRTRGQADVYPLPAIDFIQRDDYGSIQYTELEI